MNENNGLEAKISEEEITITIMIDLNEIFPHLIRNFRQRQTWHRGITIPTVEDQMINAKINHSEEPMEIDPEMDLSTIRMKTGQTMGTSLVLHPWSKERLFSK